MRDYVYSRHGSLVLAEEAQDERSIKAALKEIDRRLVLHKEVDEERSCWRYRVLRVVSNDQPAEHLCYWIDEYGNPLPLSSRLVEDVRGRLDGHVTESVDAYNARLTAERKKEATDEVRETVAEMLPLGLGKKSSPPLRSQKLRQSRDRQRAAGRNV